jgi:hypothetical protein
MHRSGVVEIRTFGREKHYWIKAGALGSPSEPRQRREDAVLDHVAGGVLRLGARLAEIAGAGRLHAADALMVSTELRQLLSEIVPPLRSGIPMNMLSRRQYVGEEFIETFLADMRAILR